MAVVNVSLGDSADAGFFSGAEHCEQSSGASKQRNNKRFITVLFNDLLIRDKFIRQSYGLNVSGSM